MVRRSRKSSEKYFEKRNWITFYWSELFDLLLSLRMIWFHEISLTFEHGKNNFAIENIKSFSKIQAFALGQSCSIPFFHWKKLQRWGKEHPWRWIISRAAQWPFSIAPLMTSSEKVCPGLRGFKSKWEIKPPQKASPAPVVSRTFSFKRLNDKNSLKYKISHFIQNQFEGHGFFFRTFVN